MYPVRNRPVKPTGELPPGVPAPRPFRFPYIYVISIIPFLRFFDHTGSHFIPDIPLHPPSCYTSFPVTRISVYPKRYLSWKLLLIHQAAPLSLQSRCFERAVASICELPQIPCVSKCPVSSTTPLVCQFHYPDSLIIQKFLQERLYPNFYDFFFSPKQSRYLDYAVRPKLTLYRLNRFYDFHFFSLLFR